MGALPKNIIRFDSRLEFQIFELLRKHISRRNIAIHHQIILKPETTYSSTVSYFVDFRIIHPRNNGFLYIEAKGLLTPEALLKLKMLEITHPEVRKDLILCSTRNNYYFGAKYLPSLTLSQLSNHLTVFLND